MTNKSMVISIINMQHQVDNDVYYGVYFDNKHNYRIMNYFNNERNRLQRDVIHAIWRTLRNDFLA